jgi:hypothetical protein
LRGLVSSDVQRNTLTRLATAVAGAGMVDNRLDVTALVHKRSMTTLNWRNTNGL